MTTAAIPRPLARSRLAPLVLLGVAVLVLQLAFATTETFPADWNIGLAEPINDFNSWARDNRMSHPLFVFFFEPVSDVISWGFEAAEAALLWLPWFVLPALVFLLVLRAGKPWAAALVAIGTIYPGLVGMWDTSMETMALMAVSVLASLAIGIPTGIWAALNPKVERTLRPVLDAMQTVPATVYLIPVSLFFGIALVPAAIATIIYAIPPAIRLTTLGIRRVSAETVEAARVFGSTKLQILTKVQLPLAIPSIMTGVNQTIMMALGIVVIASFIGAGGLGQEILNALQLRSPGRGVQAGLAIVALAMVLDRVGRTFVERPQPGVGPRHSRRLLITGLGLLAVLAVIFRLLGLFEFPSSLEISYAEPIDQAVRWARDTFYPVTKPFNDFLVASVLLPIQRFLESALVWPALVVVAAWVCWRAKGLGLAVFAAIGLLVVGLTGMWQLSIDTLTQTMVAVALSLLLAIPLGIWTGRSPRVERALNPILDTLQTIPSFVYIIPVVMLFTVGRVPGIIASVLYAIPPGIRLTALGIKTVSSEAVEASQAFGATPRQTLWKVRVPLAAPVMMAGVNQVIMMVLAMVVIAGMVGGGGLGFEAVRALTRSNVGLGVEVGIAIVIMAMILDRLTQAWAERARPPSAA